MWYLARVRSTDPLITSLYGGDRVYKNAVLPVFTFFTVLSATNLLALSLRRNKAWRNANKSQPTGSKATLENKELRAIKMVMSIAIVFIIYSIPFSVFQEYISLYRGSLSMGAIGIMYVYSVAGMLSQLVDCINCSANVIIYYNMSSKFSQVLRNMFNREA